MTHHTGPNAGPIKWGHRDGSTSPHRSPWLPIGAHSSLTRYLGWPLQIDPIPTHSLTTLDRALLRHSTPTPRISPPSPASLTFRHLPLPSHYPPLHAATPPSAIAHRFSPSTTFHIGSPRWFEYAAMPLPRHSTYTATSRHRFRPNPDWHTAAPPPASAALGLGHTRAAFSSRFPGPATLPIPPFSGMNWLFRWMKFICYFDCLSDRWIKCDLLSVDVLDECRG